MARLRRVSILGAATLALCGATSALAHDHGATATVMSGGGNWGYPQMAYPQQPDPEWQRMLDRCRIGAADNHVGGTLIGGAVGGLVGNRVADGDRALGTVAGAVVGAVAGTAIDKAEDKGLDRECEEFFRSHGPAAGPGAGYAGHPGYAPYGYMPNGYMMVPVTMVAGPHKPCTETTTTTEEWVDVPVRSRTIPRRAAPRDKRVRDKRVHTGS